MKGTIGFNYQTDFELENEARFSNWIFNMVSKEGFGLGDVQYIFTDDDSLLQINQDYLNHDTFTDIITFDYSEGKTLSADIFISVDRVTENANKYKVVFEVELLRVMSHGILHLLGYGDKTDDERMVMRKREDESIELFHVER